MGWIDGYISDGEYVLLGEDGAPFLNPTATKAYLIRGKAWVNNHAHVLRSKYNNAFLCHYLNYFSYKGFVSGTTRLKLTQSAMKRIPIPVPPLPEQDCIVAHIEELFSQLDASMNELKTTKEQLKMYRQAVLKEVFGKFSPNEYKPLKVAISDGPQNGLYKPKSSYGRGTRILRIDGFYDGFIASNYEFKRLVLTSEEINKYSLNEDDIVINRVNSTQYLGKCALVRALSETAVFESNIMRIKLDTDLVDPAFVTYYLSSVNGRRELTKNAKHAVNQASINQTDVENSMVPIPDKEVQERIVEEIESTFSTCGNIEQVVATALQQVEALRQSILKKSFEGE